jgi:hypothetical protein
VGKQTILIEKGKILIINYSFYTFYQYTLYLLDYVSFIENLVVASGLPILSQLACYSEDEIIIASIVYTLITFDLNVRRKSRLIIY